MVVSILPLRVSAASVRRRGKRLIGPVDLEVGINGFTVVIGPNGAGKTSLLRLLHGLERPGGGEVLWGVDEIEARVHQAYVFQSPIMMRRSALDSVAYALRVHGVSRRRARERAREWLEKVGLAGAADRPAKVLSGGERQKLALARALIREPQILFLDEPCASLDGSATREIEAILDEALRHGVRVLMSTHDMGQARRLATEVLFMHKGLIHEAAPAEAFFADPATAEARAFLKGDILE
jgi:tungstate transport system ATP-binding protein